MHLTDRDRRMATDFLVRLDQSRVERGNAILKAQEEARANISTHRLYGRHDKDAPDVIRDRNGEVVLGLCRDCGAGEIELELAPCSGLVKR